MAAFGSRVAVLAFALLAACPAGQQDPADTSGDGGIPCRTSDQCDDHIDCTVDTCGVARVCEFQPIDALCTGAGERCIVGRGCVAGACTSSADCDDGIACTTDTCAVGATCEHTPLDALCPDSERCDPDTGCVPLGECTTAAECDDDIECTVDRCEVGYVCTNTPHDEICPTTVPPSRCDAAIGCYEYRACPGHTDEECQDDVFCNGREQCTIEFGCRPAETPPDCTDTDPCTIDTCDAGADMCTNVVDPGIPGCDPFDPGRHMSGCFSIIPTISQVCAVRYNFSQICFSLTGPVLNVTAGSYTLSQVPAPSTADFDAGPHVVAGGCEERYAISGTFSDANTLGGTWTARYIDFDGFSCAFGGCSDQNISFTGTRVSGP